ncbi:MAG: hypothetical protein F6K40_34890 [Okeania sp. SIO3I5]|uniref:hypothetical protein n=1 Tax=Okeania sp. SIO3I5 TaxID=2607805 RepID=UPI0013BBB654|nr:hypothetical protein [Okeania sp. SIO3I5]NEQ41119.1 hypothetical protein [Okeania sp. SIO3I5]
MNWVELGTISPDHEWKIFPQEVGDSSTFMAEFSTDWDAWEKVVGYRSYAILRYYYNDSVGLSIRLYPQTNSVVFNFDSVIEGSKKLGIKRVLSYRPQPYRQYNLRDFSCHSVTLNWSIKLFVSN